MRNLYKSGIALIILILLSEYLLGQTLPDSTRISPLPLSKWQQTKQKIDKVTSHPFYRITYIGVPLIAAGYIVKGENDHFRTLRNAFVPKFRHHYDDYLQYAPAVGMLGLKLAGVEGRSSWGRMLVSDAFSVALMAAAVNSIKQTSHVMRPDGSSRNSFPSGHTATAFMAATMLHKEYGLTRSPWYSIAGYSIATFTGVSRQLNNRHWLSDVMVGAGIGILSTELGYFLADLIFKEKGLKHKNLEFEPANSERAPSFFGYNIGFSLALGKHDTPEGIHLSTGTGASAGFEGAYFFNNHFGIGARVRACSVSTTLSGKYVPGASSIQPAVADILSTDAGAYFSYPFTARWRIESKLIMGAQYSSGGTATAYFPDNEIQGLKSMDIFKIHEFHSFGIGTGLAHTYIVHRNFSVKLFTDYDFIPSHFAFTLRKPEGSQRYQTTKPTHLLTLGASININF